MGHTRRILRWQTIRVTAETYSLPEQRARMAAGSAVNSCRCLTRRREKSLSALKNKAKGVAAASEDAKTDRLTLRLPSRELERLRELARQRRTDVATLAREAIGAYLDANPREDFERLERALREAMRAEASRVIERHDETTRALIAALNEHLSRPAGKP